MTGKKFEDLAPKQPSLDKIVKDYVSAQQSKYSLRVLGRGEDGELKISEEQRADHMHIIGTTRRGKSKFIEYLIREDIDRENGLCLIDPSENGDTMYKVLDYCIQSGYEKVCVIDPHLIEAHGKVACIQPFHYEHDLPSYKAASVENIKETIKVLFNLKSYTEQPVVNKYLTAVLNVLYNARLTLHEARYFAEFEKSAARRKQILNKSFEFDSDRLTLEESFKNYQRFDKNIGSTTRRLEPFLNSVLDLMFGADSGIDFQKMIKERWVILVNGYAGRGVNQEQTVVITSAVINELIYAMDKMINNGWQGVYYLYIDEAGRYANRNLANLLSYKGKTGLRIILSHQYFGQFEDPFILKAIKQMPKIKVMFDTPNYEDRMEMIKLLGYGGDIPHEAAAYATKGLAKQECVIAVGNDAPRRMKVPDVPDITIDRNVKEAFISKILTQDWCLAPQDIRKQQNQRFKHEFTPIQPQQTDNSRPSETEPKTDDQAAHETVKGKSAFSRTKPSGNK